MLWFSSHVFVTVWKCLMLILNTCSTAVVHFAISFVANMVYKVELSLLSASTDCCIQLCTCSYFPHLPCSQLTSPDHLFTRISSALQPCGCFTVPRFIVVARLPSCFFFFAFEPYCISKSSKLSCIPACLPWVSHTPWQIQYDGFSCILEQENPCPKRDINPPDSVIF